MNHPAFKANPVWAILAASGLGILILLASCHHAKAGSLNLAWDASPASANVTNYVLYASTNTLTITNATVKLNVGTNTTAAVDNLAVGQWNFGVTAVAAGNVQSDLSAVLPVQVPPPPTNMRTIIVQYSASLTNGFSDVGFFKIRAP